MNRRDLTAVQWGAFLAAAVLVWVTTTRLVDDPATRWWLAAAMTVMWCLGLVWAAADVAKDHHPKP